MKMWIFFLALGISEAVGAPQTRRDRVSAGWTVYKNGKVYTADPEADSQWSRNPYQAIAIYDGIIECLGTNAAVDSCVSDLGGAIINEYDLQDKYIVMPGFHDVHQHPLESGSDVGGTCSVPDDVGPDSNKMLAALDECSYLQQKGTSWFLGHGHSIVPMLDYLADPSNPDPRTYLDGLFFDENGEEMPAVFLEETSHSVWVNSLALNKAGITKDTPNPVGGIILHNELTNEPNGILLENAGNMMLDRAFNITENPDLAQYAIDGLRWALGEMSSKGITSIVDARSFWQRKDDQAWEALQTSGELPVRAILALWAYPELDDDYQINELKTRFTNSKNSLLRKSMIKIYMDGLIEAYTAALVDPYEQDIYGGLIPENRGIHYFTQDRLTKYMSQLQNLNGKGFDFLVHSIGDEAVRDALNAVRDSTQDGFETRHRLTHVELVSEEDLPRFKDLHVLADPQVAGNWTLFDSPDHEDLMFIIGEERANRSIPVKELQSAGAKLTLSSDWDVSDPNPFLGLKHAISRGHEAVDLQSAVEMYTINAAFAMRQEDITGSLTVGKEADLIVVDQDIFNIEVNKIENSLVLQTVLQGFEVWKHKNFS